MKKQPSVSKTKIPNPTTYASLVKLIKQEIAQGRKDIRQRLALMYWKVGRYIAQHLLHHKDRAGYGERLFERLEVSLQIDKSTLHKAVKFYQTYPIVGTGPHLDWGHYRKLLSIRDFSKRRALEEEVVAKKLNTRQLQQEINSQKAKDNLSKGKGSAGKGEEPIPLPLQRGQFWIYKIIEPTSVPARSKEVVVDCGFNVWRQVPVKGGVALKTGDLVEAVPSGQEDHLKKSEAKPNELFTYQAVVERVIDADTLWVHIDCGFKMWVRQNLRLHWIDVPEIDTPHGRKAKRFLEQLLKPLKFIVVKTYASDKYARYLADVFYLPGKQDPQDIASQGEFLNQRLLDEGLARVWEPKSADGNVRHE